MLAETLGSIRAWPLGPPGRWLCPIVIPEGVNNSPRLRTRANAGSTRAAGYPAQLLALRAMACAMPRACARLCTPPRADTCRNTSFGINELRVTKSLGARQTFQTQAQRKLQGDWRAARIDVARGSAHQHRGVAQSLACGTSAVAPKQFHRYFVQNEVLQHGGRVVRPDPSRRHDSCLCSG